MQALDLFFQTLHGVLGQVGALLPRLLGALFLLVAGLILAGLLRRGVHTLLGRVRFRHLAERSGVEAFLHQARIPLSLEGILGALAYWLAVLFSLGLAASVLELAVVAALFNRAVLYLPHAIGAVFVLVFGILAARAVNRLLFAMLTGLRFRGALTLSTLAEMAITVFAVFLALEQALVDSVVVNSAFRIGFGALALALAIAFGLAGQARAAQAIKALSEKRAARPRR